MRPVNSSVTLLVASALLVAGCGSGNSDEPSVDNFTEDAPTEAADPGADTSTAVSIDPAEMPEVGTIEVEVDGQTFTFTADDPAALSFDCELSGDRVELDHQAKDNSRAMHAEYGDATKVGGDPGTWLGNTTVTPGTPDSDAKYRGDGQPQPSGAIAIEPPYVKITIDAGFSPAPSSTDSKPVGKATISATCPTN